MCRNFSHFVMDYGFVMYKYKIRINIEIPCQNLVLHKILP
jgi:hypothetical protein